MTFANARARWVRRGRVVGAVAVVLALGLASCSDDDGGDAGTTSSTTTEAGSTTTAVDRPEGPAADISEELSGGDGIYVGAAERPDLEGYEEHEYLASGTATSYSSAGELTEDGKWTFEPADTADYRTRVIVRRPAKAADASGIVLVEWMNVSGGVDADPEFTTLREEILREGHTWVGVSAQVIGVEGGPVAVKVDVPGSEDAGKGLKAIDPERYGSLEHPGDAYAYDIYSQVARALREGGPALGGAAPEKVVAVGESQSAFALVTYVNGVQPLTKAFDGFFVHSRGAAGLPLPEAGTAADISGSIGGTKTIFRTDTDVPVFDIQTENDVVGVFSTAAVRQPDTDVFRLWEVPGTAHADLHLIGESTAEFVDCGVPINDGPFHVVAKAALRHFVAWVGGGDEPPNAPPIETTDGDAPEMQRDPDGIALGGVRTPPVDVPVRVLSGVKGPSDEVICLLLGSTLPMSEERLAELYSSRDDFEQQYDAAVDEAIDAGYVLEEDREAVLDYAHPELVAG
jgi:Alpha/beta hydrolase domain